MKKQILVMSILAALYGCDLDNLDDKKVPATFENNFTTEVGFYGTEANGFDVKLTSGHGSASGTLIVNDVNYGEAEPNYDNIPVGKYGTFTLEYLQSGYATWTYDLREEVEPGQEEVQAATVQQVKDLIADPTLPALIDTLTITTLDGTTRTITFIIDPVPDDAPTVIKGALVANASIRETSAYGSVKVYDPHFGESTFTSLVDEQGNPIGILSEKGYGSLFIGEDGRWEFKVDKKANGLKELLLTPDDLVTDTVTFSTADGTTETLNVNIYGAVPNFVAAIPSTTDVKSVFSINMDQAGVPMGKTTDGKMTFKLKITEDLAKTATFAMACHSNFHTSDSRRVATFFIKPDGQLEMWSGILFPGKSYDDRTIPNNFDKNQSSDNVIFDQRLVPGEWSEFTMVWEGASNVQKPLLKAWLDGTQLTSDHGAIPTNPDEFFVSQTLGGKTVVQCVDEMQFFVNSDENVGGTGAFLVDDIQFYTDKDADPIFEADTKALLNEKFANNQVGDVVMDITVEDSKLYDHASTDNVLIGRD